MKTEYEVPAAKGDRSIVFRVGYAESGFLENCLLLFRGSKSNKSSDYHTKMNWFVFVGWNESKVFPAMKRTMEKSVLALECATYHKFLDEEDKRPSKYWNKTKLANTIVRWDGAAKDDHWRGEFKSRRMNYWNKQEKFMPVLDTKSKK